jgi:hypothetical protein
LIVSAAIAYFAFGARLFCCKNRDHMIGIRTLVADIVVVGVRESEKTLGCLWVLVEAFYKGQVVSS